MIFITSEESEGPLGPAIHDPRPILEKAAKAERGELDVKEMEELIELSIAREQMRRLAHANSEPSRGDSLQLKPAEPPGLSQEQMKLLFKELRELIDVMKADRQGKLAPAQTR
jgi:hypothetical protein